MLYRVVEKKGRVICLGLLLALAAAGAPGGVAALLRNAGNIHLAAIFEQAPGVLKDPNKRVEWPLGLSVKEQDSSAANLLETALSFAPQDARSHRSIGLFYSMAGDKKTAAIAFEQAVAVDQRDLTTKLGLANLSRTTGQPVQAVHYYEEILPDVEYFDEKSQRHYKALMRRWLDVENVRAGHELALDGKDEKARTYINAGLEAHPENVVSLYDRAMVDSLSGISFSESAQALESCQFRLPEDKTLIAYLPGIAATMKQRRQWSDETAAATFDFVDWSRSGEGLHGRADEGLIAEGSENLLAGHPLLPRPESAQPAYWKWDVWVGKSWRSGVFFGGLEGFEELQENALRISGICIGNEPERAMPHAGFSPWAPWPRVEVGRSYRLSFLYRTDPDSPGSPGVYISWGEGTPERVRSALELAPTQGEWHRYEHILSNPLESQTVLYLNLRSFGMGTVWFADLGLYGMG